MSGGNDPGTRRRFRINRLDATWIALVWAVFAFISFFIDPNYDAFSKAELAYYSVYNVVVGALVGFYLFDRAAIWGVARSAAAAVGLVVAGTLINEGLVEPIIFRTGPINSEGLYYGLLDAAMSAAVFMLIRLSRELSSIRQRIVDSAAARRLIPNSAGFLVRVAGETRRIFAADVLYMQAEKDFTRIICSNGEHFVSENLKTLVEKSGQFDIVRIHKSFAANLNKVERVTHCEASIGEVRVPVGRRYREAFEDRWKAQFAGADRDEAVLTH